MSITIMKTVYLFLTLFLFSNVAYSQQWIDTTYKIKTTENIEYGKAIDFAGAEKTLLMDISFPTNDTPPKCGRPLLVVVHGGAWLAGSKDEATIKMLRMDYAKRGYVTAALNYRLGQFHTEKNLHCNVDGWDCNNITDSAEWYRAYYRAVQDVNGAIRYLINNADEMGIDPNNIFLAGESAGAFTVIGAAYIDSQSEVLTKFTQKQTDAPTPNTLYEKPCIQKYELANSIADMKLQRPDLGSYEGTLNQPVATTYKIRGVAGFYGGVMNNIFGSTKPDIPALYMFHQPNDLIVPINYGTVFEGYNKCTNEFLSCQGLISLKYLWGSQGMKQIIDTMKAFNISAPDYIFEKTNNNANCIEQVADPSKGGHQYDNYWLRTNNAAKYFANYIVDCSTSTGIDDQKIPKFEIYPNPIESGGVLKLQNAFGTITITDVMGKVIFTKNNIYTSSFTIEIDQLNLSNGVYIISIDNNNLIQTSKFIVQ